MRTTSVMLVVGLMVAVSACESKSSPSPVSALLTAPTPESPIEDALLNTLRPTLTVRNGTSNVAGDRVYQFQISDKSDFSANVMSYIQGYAVTVSQGGVPEGATGRTSFTPTSDLQPSTRLFWRARFTQDSNTSDWSPVTTFRTRGAGIFRPGELFDPLVNDTLGTRVGSTTFLGPQGLRLDTNTSWVRYELMSTMSSGEISVEVEGLRPNSPGLKSRIFSMMDGGPVLYHSNYLFNVQYRGAGGNPDNAISYKVLMGSPALEFEPDFGQRAAGVRQLNPSTTYLWTATWGSTFRLTVHEGGVGGSIIYDVSRGLTGTYNPSPHVVYLGANDAQFESGSFAGAIYRNLWVGVGPRPQSLGSGAHSRPLK